MIHPSRNDYSKEEWEEIKKLHMPDKDKNFIRPVWLSEEKYKNLVKEKGIHWFILEFSLEDYHKDLKENLSLRVIIILVFLILLIILILIIIHLEYMQNVNLKYLITKKENEKLKELNLAAAGLTHETKNPLNIIRYLGSKLENHQDREVREVITDILEEADRTTERLSSFLKYAKITITEIAKIDISKTIMEVWRIIKPDDQEFNLEIIGQNPIIRADKGLFRQLIINLLLNSIQMPASKGYIRISLKEKKNNLSILFEDNGPGIATELREKIFEPYYTTKNSGSGLGLAVVKRIAEVHKWQISCVDSEFKGAGFLIENIEMEKQLD